MRQPRGLFIGLTTLDLIYHAPAAPRPNEKQVAQSMMFAAGGPATNAAIAFAALGGKATLCSVVGQHPLAKMIDADLAQQGIQHLDLMPQRSEPPSVSSIVVSTQTGDRAIISKNAQGSQVLDINHWMLQLHPILDTVDIVLIDGHQMALSQNIIAKASEQNVPTLLDGGSWKQGCDQLLPYLSHIICSETFRAPQCGNESETLQYLRSHAPHAHLAITHGGDPITLNTPFVQTTCPCPSISVTDTLGAGDFFHGAFAFWISQLGFEASIQAASRIASLSCQFPGTRSWLSEISDECYP